MIEWGDSMNNRLHGFSVSHLDQAEFSSPPGQPYFTARDLGVAAATNGFAHAQIVRAAVLGNFRGQQRHSHDVLLHFVYLVSGWIRCEFEDQGVVTMKAGSSSLQPGGAWHAVLAASDDFEALEFVSPAGSRPEILKAKD